MKAILIVMKNYDNLPFGTTMEFGRAKFPGMELLMIGPDLKKISYLAKTPNSKARRPLSVLTNNLAKNLLKKWKKPAVLVASFLLKVYVV